MSQVTGNLVDLTYIITNDSIVKPIYYSEIGLQGNLDTCISKKVSRHYSLLNMGKTIERKYPLIWGSLEDSFYCKCQIMNCDVDEE